jgi:hypothetical protein
MNPFLRFLIIASLSISFSACTQEVQNQISRSIQNWTGTDGVLDILSEGKVMYRFIKIDKLTTATATGGGSARPYRFGYGVLDLNQNYVKEENEKKIYFEVSDFGTNYVFYENPHK